jgi:hypothetical protein
MKFNLEYYEAVPQDRRLGSRFAIPRISEETAMKASSLFLAGLAASILSIAPAKADHKCSTTTWPMLSAVQCSKPKATSYAECQTMVRKNGSTASDAWWWCSSQGFKS